MKMVERYCHRLRPGRRLSLLPPQPHQPQIIAPTLIARSALALLLMLSGRAAEPLEQWYRRSPGPTAERLFSVAHGNDNFVAVGLGGAIVSSADGTNWLSQSSRSEADLYGIAFGNGTFVAVGREGAILFYNGLAWNGVSSG